MTGETTHDHLDRRFDDQWDRIEDRFKGVDQRFNDLEKLNKSAFESQAVASEKAVVLAEQAAALASEYNKQALTRYEYQIQHQILIDRLGTVEKSAAFNKIQTIIFGGMMTGIFSILMYLVFLHVR